MSASLTFAILSVSFQSVAGTKYISKTAAGARFPCPRAVKPHQYSEGQKLEVKPRVAASAVAASPTVVVRELGYLIHRSRISACVYNVAPFGKIRYVRWQNIIGVAKQEPSAEDAAKSPAAAGPDAARHVEAAQPPAATSPRAASPSRTATPLVEAHEPEPNPNQPPKPKCSLMSPFGRIMRNTFNGYVSDETGEFNQTKYSYLKWIVGCVLGAYFISAAILWAFGSEGSLEGWIDTFDMISGMVILCFFGWIGISVFLGIELAKLHAEPQETSVKFGVASLLVASKVFLLLRVGASFFWKQYLHKSGGVVKSVVSFCIGEIFLISFNICFVFFAKCWGLDWRPTTVKSIGDHMWFLIATEVLKTTAGWTSAYYYVSSSKSSGMRSWGWISKMETSLGTKGALSVLYIGIALHVSLDCLQMASTAAINVLTGVSNPPKMPTEELMLKGAEASPCTRWMLRNFIGIEQTYYAQARYCYQLTQARVAVGAGEEAKARINDAITKLTRWTDILDECVAVLKFPTSQNPVCSPQAGAK